jgi:hypothetical protein
MMKVVVQFATYMGLTMNTADALTYEANLGSSPLSSSMIRVGSISLDPRLRESAVKGELNKTISLNQLKKVIGD